MRNLLLGAIAAAGLMFSTSADAETQDCTEITTIPIVITVQGVYCLKGNLVTSATTGNMIHIQTNNVTIDFNGFKLGGSAAGTGTDARGVFADDRKNIVLRNGSIRGFYYGIWLKKSISDDSSGHLIEEMILDGNRFVGIVAEGTGMVVRYNRVVNTGPTDLSATAFGIAIANASNSLIVGNLVSKTTETNITYGIYAFSSSLIEIRGNSVLETDGATTDRGIYLSNTDDTTVIDNRVLNAAGTGTNGIQVVATSAGINCIDNTVAGFTTGTSGCDFVSGNHTPSRP